MAKVQHTVTGCVPVDKAALEVYAALVTTNESATVAEDSRQEAEGQGTYSDPTAYPNTRRAKEAERQAAETERTRVFGEDHTRANSDHGIAAGDHSTATDDHRIAGEDHTTATSDHGIASGDHTTAASDHNKAVSDHGTASSDHNTASSDHNRAVSDHGIASSDHTTADNDHTTAGNDHTRAESDHTRAESDHSAIAGLETRIETVEGKIPSEASSANQLADKAFVNSSVATATATFRGTYNLVTDLELSVGATHSAIEAALGTEIATADNNDYSFVQIPTATATPTQIASVERYKYNGSAWGFEYALNNSGFTDDQWAALNSGITSALVTKLGALPTAADLAAAFAGKVDKVEGKGLSTNDYSDDEKTKLSGIASGAQVNVIETVKVDGAPLTPDNKSVNIDLSNKANINGTYKTMAVGMADNLEGRSVEEDAFFVRPTGGNAEVANGPAQMLGVKGNSQVWNQLMNNGSATVVFGHKYYSRINGTASVGTSAGTGISGAADDDIVIDLTLAGYPDIATTTPTVAEVEAWLAANVGLFDYYPYNAGTVLNNSMTGLESIGFNLLDPATGKAELPGAYSDLYGNYYGITGTHGTLTFTDRLGNTSTVTPDSDGKFLIETPGTLDVASAGDDCSVFLWWDGTKTEYEEYQRDVARLDVTHIWGKEDGTGTLKRIWANGMPGFGDNKDALDAEGAKVLIGSRAYASGDESDSSVITDGTTTYYVLSTPKSYPISSLVYKDSPYFADGTPVTLPVNYTVNNWGVERVLPVNSSESVTMAKPTITCKYSIDAVELLDTHSTQIEDLYTKNQELDERKPEKYGDYPLMNVGSAKTLAGDNSMQAEYLFRKIPDGVAAGLAQLRNVKGKSLVWNQLVVNGNFMSVTGWIATSVSYTVENNVATITKESSGAGYLAETIVELGLAVGHKFYYAGTLSGDTLSIGFKTDSNTNKGRIGVSSNNATRVSNIYTLEAEDTSFVIRPSNAATGTFTAKDIILIDLTLMFGAGNEPTTVTEFEALFPAPYYANNAGTIINNKAEKLVTVGFNQWDEEWEVGAIDSGTGLPATDATAIRSKNFCVVLDQEYYCKGSGWLFFYDSNYAYLGYRIRSNSSVTPPSGSAYFKIVIPNTTTYNHDICINISNASLNGTYKPYEKHELELNMTTLTGKLNGEGESVVISPDGLKSAGTAYDYGVIENGYLTKIVKRIGVVDLGTLYWDDYATVGGAYPYGMSASLLSERAIGAVNLCSSNYAIVSSWSADKGIRGDSSSKALYIIDSSFDGKNATQVKAAMSGVMLNYELAEPLVYVLDTPVYVGYQTDGSVGTEAIIPEGVDTNGVPNTAPFVCEVSYPVDAVGFIQSAPKSFQSQDSMDALITVLNSALNGTITKTWSAEANKWTYTFTPNA